MLNNIIFTQLKSKFSDISFDPTELKISPFMENFGTLLVYSSGLSKQLYRNDKLQININDFCSTIYKYPHYDLCKRSDFGHLLENCSSNVVKCYLCGQNHLYSNCDVTIKRCFACFGSAHLG